MFLTSNLKFSQDLFLRSDIYKSGGGNNLKICVENTRKIGKCIEGPIVIPTEIRDLSDWV